MNVAKVRLKAGDLTLSEEGAIVLKFATLNVKDEDGHVTLPGAIPTKDVVMSDYGHTTWPQRGGRLPVGKGRVEELNGLGVFTGSFFLDTDQGRNAYNTVKAVGDLQEWSYGYEILESRNVPDPEDPTGKAKALGLAKLDIAEVSPVLLGAAGTGRSGTLFVKGIKEGAADTISRLSQTIWPLTESIEQEATEGEDPTEIDPLRMALMLVLRFMQEEASEIGTPEDLQRVQDAIDSYGMVPAMYASRKAIGVLDTFGHDLAKGSPRAGVPMVEMTDRLLVGVSGWKDRIAALANLRTKEGRVLSSQNRSRIQKVTDALAEVESIRKELMALLDETDPEAKAKAGQALYLDFVRRSAEIVPILTD